MVTHILVYKWCHLLCVCVYVMVQPSKPRSFLLYYRVSAAYRWMVCVYLCVLVWDVLKECCIIAVGVCQSEHPFGIIEASGACVGSILIRQEIQQSHGWTAWW